ncbi:MAG: hypothetical protein AAGC88_12070 [Bacteroidota bacterium]
MKGIMTKQTINNLILLMLAVFVYTSCGDDDEPDPEPAPPIEEVITVSSVSDATAVEGSPITHTVTLSAGGSSENNFAASLTDGTATSEDYDSDLANAILDNGVTYSSGEFTVPSGVSSFSVSISTIADAIDEEDKTYTLTVGDQSGTGTITDDDLPPAYIIQSTVQTPDGTRTVFFNVISSLSDPVDLADATEFNSNSRMMVANGKVYVFDSENVQVVRFGVDETGNMIEEDVVSMVGLGASGFGGTNAIVSEEHAIAFVQGIRQFVFFNPSSMEITGTLAYPDIIPDAFRAGFNAAVAPDGRVFYGFSGFDFGTFSNQPGARVIIVDPVLQTAETIFDESIAAGTEGAIDSNGDYYFNADAYFGFGRYLVAENREPTQTVQRIKLGESSFDPTFNLSATKIAPEGYPQMSAGGFVISGDRFASIYIPASDEEIAANPQGALFAAALGRQLYAGSSNGMAVACQLVVEPA